MSRFPNIGETRRLAIPPAGGFTLLEILLSVTMLSVTVLALGGTLLSGVRTTAELDRSARIRDQGLRYMERLQRLPVGDSADSAPSTEVLDRLFRDGSGLPALTLFQVRTPPDGDGRRFRVAGFEADGEWEIRVNEDVNGNGVTDGDESDFDVFRIEILFEGLPILRTFRARRAEVD